MPTTILVAPAGRRVGLTTACLGLVRALDRQGVRVAFVKPIANREVSQSAELMALGAHILPVKSVPIHTAEVLLAAGDDQTLMEHVVEIAGKAGVGADVLIVEGMNPEPGIVHASRVNELMLKALDAELVFVAAPRSQNAAEVADAIAIAARGYGALAEGRQVSCILNRVCIGAGGQQSESETIGQAQGGCADCQGVAPFAEMEAAHRKALESVKLRPLAVVPCSTDLAAPRVLDVAQALKARVVFAGEMRTRRVSDVGLCAANVPNALRALRPGSLIITPGDRSDIMMAAALSVQSGTPLAGLLLTGGHDPDPRVIRLCRKALDSGLPVLAVDESSYRAATHVAGMNTEIPADDPDRIERTMNFVADRIDIEWVKGFGHSTRVPRLSPPAFRHRLIEQARTNLQRIVLPEGAEPRTVAAAAIVANRGIARCVLLGNPDEIREVAAKQGVTLPASVEIVDPVAVAARYVEPLVERRRAKGMTPERAAVELQDPIMVGTMMLALDEASGLGVGRHPQHGAHHPAGAPDHQDRAGLQPRVEHLLHVSARAGARVRRLRGRPEPDGPGTGRHRHSERRFGYRVRHTGAGGHAVVLDRVERHRRGCREGEGGDAHRQGTAPRPRARRAAAVRRGRNARRRAAEGARIGRGGEGDGADLPGPEYRERHLQGGPAIGKRGEHGADAPGHGQAGERPVARLPGRGHRLHDQPDGDPGAASRAPEGRGRAVARLDRPAPPAPACVPHPRTPAV